MFSHNQMCFLSYLICNHVSMFPPCSCLFFSVTFSFTSLSPLTNCFQFIFHYLYCTESSVEIEALNHFGAVDLIKSPSALFVDCTQVHRYAFPRYKSTR